MPYKGYKKSMRYKRRRKRRYNPAKNSGNSTLRTIGNVAGTALSIAKFAASVLNVEDKYLDTNINFQPKQITPAQLCLNLVPQGTDNNQRIGRQIRVKSLELNFNFASLAATSDNHVWIKYYIVIDKKHSGGGVFPLNEYLTANDEVSFRNPDYSNRFQTIKKNTIELVKGTAKDGVHIEEYIDLTNNEYAKTEFDGTGGTLGDISAYPIYIVYVSSASVTGFGDIRGIARIRYVDN